jgi:hypothetical protein
MIDALLGVIVAVSAGVVAFLVHLARERAIDPRTVRLLATLCGVGLVAMLLSDWPFEVLAGFWADHSILAAITSTVLLIGLVFLLYEEREQREQERLDEGLSSAGLGGVVDHLVDVEVALGCLSAGEPPAGEWGSWGDPARPLRWLRADRPALFADQGGPRKSDPRGRPPTLRDDSTTTWRVELIDQCVRRLLSGLRDWTPLIGTSKNGVIALLAISELRKDLMELASLTESHRPEAGPLLVTLRQRLRILTFFFEERSGARPHRPEVLQTMHPLPRVDVHFTWSADTKSADMFDKRWNQLLMKSIERLERDERV